MQKHYILVYVPLKKEGEPGADRQRAIFVAHTQDIGNTSPETKGCPSRLSETVWMLPRESAWPLIFRIANAAEQCGTSLQVRYLTEDLPEGEAG